MDGAALTMLPDPADEELHGLALDFVEQELGQFYAAENWQRLRQAGATEQAIAEWLARWHIGDVPASRLAARLDQLFAEGRGNWPRGFTY
jgi:hypothetical protein